jgi:predicted exporter
MSVGFAAIMIGLSVDYGYFVYQRSQVVRGDLRELRRECLQNIAWTASTTATAFFALNLSSLPGLSQLGNLVGLGVIIGSCVMLGLFAPLTHRYHRHEEKRVPTAVERLFASATFVRIGTWLTSLLVAGLLLGLAVRGWPKVDLSADSLRPRKSEAYDALNRLQSRLVNDKAMLSLVVRGQTEGEVLTRLQTAEQRLTDARDRGEVISFRSVLPLWPHVENQRANLPVLSTLAAELPRLKQTMLDGGFNEEAFALTENIVGHWAAWAARPLPIWPENETSRWLFRRAASREPGRFLALGMVEPVPGGEDALTQKVQGDGIFLVSWLQLGNELRRVIPQEFRNIIAVLSILTVATLAWGFKSWRAVVIFVGITALVLVCLCGALSLLGAKWNFFSLASLLLLLGTGTDYSILLLLALRRNGGDVAAAHREMGIVVALCASSAAAGFGTIAWANNMGLASLGQACAIGLGLDALISIFLLPRAWELLHRRPVQAAASAV